ncbi:hypothetical protein [Cribrihabitans marinus]|uniref:hypothetical protein n=1 Tax=Cribrihabitans marinus TaxID=1227549 RepID=UPI001E3EC93A|nr:hypothetical protein [Cribrihabitans marinus]
MPGHRGGRGLIVETLAASGAYLAAVTIVFTFLMPVQNLFFPEYPSRASLLFLPHGVRILTAWLLGPRAIVALLPGVALLFLYVAGWNTFAPTRLAGIAVVVCAAPLIFEALKRLGADIYPHPGRTPCWICVMGVGAVTSLVSAGLLNLLFGNGFEDWLALFIGDVFGLFFLMLGLLFVFRWLDRRRT